MEGVEHGILDDGGELGNYENLHLFAEFKVREAGLNEWAAKIRDDYNMPKSLLE
jgi:hypothetical protein